MTLLGDWLSGFIKRAADMLVVLNPRGTSLGVFFGITVDGTLKLLAPVTKATLALDPSKASPFHYIAAGVFAFNIPLLFRRHQLPPEIEEALAVIKVAEAAGMSKTQIKLRYLALCERVIARATEQASKEEETVNNRPAGAA